MSRDIADSYHSALVQCHPSMWPFYWSMSSVLHTGSGYSIYYVLSSM